MIDRFDTFIVRQNDPMQRGARWKSKHTTEHSLNIALEAVLEVGLNGYYKRMPWLDKRYSSLALIGQELLSCFSCPIKVCVCNNRSPLCFVGHGVSCRVVCGNGKLLQTGWWWGWSWEAWISCSRRSSQWPGSRQVPLSQVQTCVLIGQEVQLSSSRPIRATEL